MEFDLKKLDTFTIWGSQYEMVKRVIRVTWTWTLIDVGPWGLKPSQRLIIYIFFLQLTSINGNGSMNKYITIYY